MVELGVVDAGSRAHPLHFAWPDRRAVTEAVLVRELAFENVGDDLHVLVVMRAEAAPRIHEVLVDDAQRAEAHVLGVVVVREREGVERVEPAVIGVAALGSGSMDEHPDLLFGSVLDVGPTPRDSSRDQASGGIVSWTKCVTRGGSPPRWKTCATRWTARSAAVMRSCWRRCSSQDSTTNDSR